MRGARRADLGKAGPMAKDLIIFGAFKIPYQLVAGNAKQITPEHASKFWEMPGPISVREKQGCYVFALRASHGFTPWYVGQATVSFHHECFHADKRDKYNRLLSGGYFKPATLPIGNPVLFLVAPRGDVHKVAVPVCDDVETFLIRRAYAKNPELINKQKIEAPDWENWTIAGVHPPKGPVLKAAHTFRKMIGLHKISSSRTDEAKSASDGTGSQEAEQQSAQTLLSEETPNVSPLPME
jgi:hypothetical protein